MTFIILFIGLFLFSQTVKYLIEYKKYQSKGIKLEGIIERYVHHSNRFYVGNILPRVKFENQGRLQSKDAYIHYTPALLLQPFMLLLFRKNKSVNIIVPKLQQNIVIIVNKSFQVLIYFSIIISLTIIIYSLILIENGYNIN